MTYKLPRQETLHKNLFSLKILIAHLIANYAPIKSEVQVIMDSITEISHQVVDKTLSMRYCDGLWRAKIKTDNGEQTPIYLLILTEFQSSSQWYMSVRMITYMFSIYTRLIEQDKGRRKVLPLFLPFVIYNGDKLWSAPFSAADLTGNIDPELAKRMFGEQNYWVIDIKRLQFSVPGEVHNLIELMARVQQDLASLSEKRAKKMLKLVSEYLKGLDDAVLTEKFSQWVIYFMFKQGEKWTEKMEVGIPDLNTIDDMEEAEKAWDNFYNEFIAKSEKSGFAKGEKSGIAKGEKIGIAKAKAKELEDLRRSISNQVTSRYGVAGSEQWREKLTRIERLEQMHLILGWMYECDDIEEFTSRLDHLIAS